MSVDLASLLFIILLMGLAFWAGYLWHIYYDRYYLHNRPWLKKNARRFAESGGPSNLRPIPISTFSDLPGTARLAAAAPLSRLARPLKEPPAEKEPAIDKAAAPGTDAPPPVAGIPAMPDPEHARWRPRGLRRWFR
jgi:hypothetical protein